MIHIKINIQINVLWVLVCWLVKTKTSVHLQLWGWMKRNVLPLQWMCTTSCFKLISLSLILQSDTLYKCNIVHVVFIYSFILSNNQMIPAVASAEWKRCLTKHEKASLYHTQTVNPLNTKVVGQSATIPITVWWMEASGTGLNFQLLFCSFSSWSGRRTHGFWRTGEVNAKQPVWFSAARSLQPFDVWNPVQANVCNIYGLFSSCLFVVACCL